MSAWVQRQGKDYIDIDDSESHILVATVFGDRTKDEPHFNKTMRLRANLICEAPAMACLLMALADIECYKDHDEEVSEDCLHCQARTILERTVNA